MDKGIFSDREQAAEAAYFRQHDARLVDRLRQDAKLEEVATALAEKLQIDNPDLLEKARLVGVTGDTAPALLLAPLVQVAWVDGAVSGSERETVLRIADTHGGAATVRASSLHESIRTQDSSKGAPPRP